ncbi:hypothetical protein NYO98_10415 [Nocardioides sp. STR2]|uniref:Uncharacterized protein n=1 Tax=Nocardioides pini TaxID=2975053 RepID=A0ABT4CD10_9ACTN|nr:hypothetical protein [Nocardioides pini]MCY4726691.1 hypothetical protein [Nocardioides pini]
MDNIKVDPGRVIAALQKQVSDLALDVAMQTARAEQAEEALADARAVADAEGPST